jgi:hypothetical protein
MYDLTTHIQFKEGRTPSAPILSRRWSFNLYLQPGWVVWRLIYIQDLWPIHAGSSAQRTIAKQVDVHFAFILHRPSVNVELRTYQKPARGTGGDFRNAGCEATSRSCCCVAFIQRIPRRMSELQRTQEIWSHYGLSKQSRHCQGHERDGAHALRILLLLLGRT